MRSDKPTDREPTDRAILAETLVEMARQAGDSGHLEHGKLLAYLRGGLSEQEERSAQNHLTTCRSCTTALLDLHGLAESDTPSPEGASDFEKALAWRSFRARLAELQRDAFRRRARFAYAAAAAMFICVLGLSVWSAFRPSAGLDQPQRDVPLIYLDSSSTRGGDGSQPAVPPRAGFVVLVLTPSQPTPLPEYRVEIVREDGRVTWSGGGLHMSEYGALRLAVPSSLLPPGRYSVRLYGSQDTRNQVLDSFNLEVPKLKE